MSGELAATGWLHAVAATGWLYAACREKLAGRTFPHTVWAANALATLCDQLGPQPKRLPIPWVRQPRAMPLALSLARFSDTPIGPRALLRDATADTLFQLPRNNNCDGSVVRRRHAAAVVRNNRLALGRWVALSHRARPELMHHKVGLLDASPYRAGIELERAVFPQHRRIR